MAVASCDSSIIVWRSMMMLVWVWHTHLESTSNESCPLSWSLGRNYNLLLTHRKWQEWDVTSMIKLHCAGLHLSGLKWENPCAGSEGWRHHVVRGLHGKEWWVTSRSWQWPLADSPPPPKKERQSYKCHELNSTSYLKRLGSGSCPSQASDETTVPTATAVWQDSWPKKLWNNKRCFELLNLWQCVMQSQKWNLLAPDAFVLCFVFSIFSSVHY